MGKALALAPTSGVFGLPPPSYTNHEMILNSMPVLEITPGEPNFSFGLTLFTINTLEGWSNYLNILSNHGFSVNAKPLKFAFIADNFPTDTFTNEYTETFLQKFTDVASSGLSQIVQMSGKSNAVEAVGSYGAIGMQAAKDLGGNLGSVLEKVAGGAQAGAAGLQNFINKSKGGDTAGAKLLGGGMDLVSKMLAGHRIDFPQIWSNSGYSPSYSVTIRLYNPNPGSKESTLQYIAGPLCALLCLAVPRTLNGASYRWPFYHKIRVKGLYELNPAVITNITVVKGGDQQQLAFNQMMSICDVRMDFISLHKSMLLEEGNPAADNRPTVRNYIDQLTNGRDVFTRAEMNNINNTRRGGKAAPQEVKSPSITQERLLAKHEAATVRLPEGIDPETTVKDRVSPEEEIVGELLVCQGETGTYVTKENTCN